MIVACGCYGSTCNVVEIYGGTIIIRNNVYAVIHNTVVIRNSGLWVKQKIDRSLYILLFHY